MPHKFYQMNSFSFSSQININFKTHVKLSFLSIFKKKKIAYKFRTKKNLTNPATTFYDTGNDSGKNGPHGPGKI